MLYCATSGFAVGATLVRGGVKLPEPQPNDPRVSKRPAEEHRVFVETFMHLRFHRELLKVG
jgi:hypothetical protein